METSTNPTGYGKRSIWQWLGIYVVVAAVLYTGAFFVYREYKDNGADDSGSTTTTTQSSLY